MHLLILHSFDELMNYITWQAAIKHSGDVIDLAARINLDADDLHAGYIHVARALVDVLDPFSLTDIEKLEFILRTEQEPFCVKCSCRLGFVVYAVSSVSVDVGGDGN